MQYAPLPTSKADGEEVNKFLTSSGFQTNLLHDTIDNNEIEEKYDELVEVAKSFTKSKKKAIFFFYYSGHGSVIDGLTVGHNVINQQIDIEKKVRKLAAYPNVYVIALFDCCREVGNQQTKGSAASEERVAGQLVMIHAVGPTKKAVTRQATGLSPVC